MVNELTMVSPDEYEYNGSCVLVRVLQKNRIVICDNKFVLKSGSCDFEG